MGVRGVLVGQKFKIWNNYQTDGPISTKFGTHVRIWHTCADASGNGHMLKKQLGP